MIAVGPSILKWGTAVSTICISSVGSILGNGVAFVTLIVKHWKGTSN